MLYKISDARETIESSAERVCVHVALRLHVDVTTG